MKRFSIIAIIIIAVLLVIDLIIGYSSRYLIFNLPNSGTLFSNNKHALSDVQTDVLIIGSSRANHHYNTRIISDELGLNSYNGGVDGHGMPMAYCVYKSVCERKKPRIVIYDNWKTQWSDNHMDDLRYLYEINPYVKRIIDINNGKSLVKKMKYKSNLYLYNNTLPRIFQSYIAGNRVSNGYIASPVKENNSLVAHIDSFDLKYNKLCMTLLEEIIQDCKDNHILLIFVMSPTLEIQKNEFMAKTDSICIKNNIVYFDYNEDCRFTQNPSLFNDGRHMNEIGADIFSKDLTSKIKPLLRNIQ